MANRTRVQPGFRSGRLVAIRRTDDYVSPSGRRRAMWLVRCDCGTEKAIQGERLTGARPTESCGCLRLERVVEARLIDLTGQRFGRLLILRRSGTQRHPNGKSTPRWAALCDCGNLTDVMTTTLRDGKVKSCGCYGAETRGATQITHGLSGGKHPLYVVWCAMRERCENPANHAFANYGGRGIYVCERWQGRDGFANYLADVGERPADPEGWESRKAYWSIDRIDNDGPYSPDNVRWASPTTQNLNQRPRRSA